MRFMKKYKILYIILSVFLIYFIYKITLFFINENAIEFKKDYPSLIIQDIIPINKDRITYLNSCYIKDKYAGENVLIDNKFYLQITLLGTSNKKFDITKIDKEIEIKAPNLFYNPEYLDLVGGYINVSKYPFNNPNLFFTSNASSIRTNENIFFELEIESGYFDKMPSVLEPTNIFISFGNINEAYLGIIFYTKYNSVSFINHNGNLYRLNLTPLKGVSFKSLHELINQQT